MFKLELSESDKRWLQVAYPGLTKEENGLLIISGEFQFDAIHTGEGHVDHEIDEAGSNHQGERISDAYEIRIEFQSSKHSDLPKVYETGGRITKIAEDRNVDLGDLHINGDGTACLCIVLEETQYFPHGFSITTFINKLVIPFFYAQSYFEKFGNWPWKTYSHGFLGSLEWYLEQGDMASEGTANFLVHLQTSPAWQIIRKELAKKKGIKGHHSCICGKQQIYRKCHKRVLDGLKKLHQDVKAFKIKI